MEWYVVVEGVRRGPMSRASVQTLINKGVLKPDTPVRKETMPDWLAIKHIRDFDLKVLTPSLDATRPPVPSPDPVQGRIAPRRPDANVGPARHSLWNALARWWRGNP